MKNSTFIGFILLGLAFLVYTLLDNFSLQTFLQPMNMMGVLGGIGIGLIIGGVAGYVSKGSAIKQEQRRKELKQLQKEKEELAKQAAALAKKQEKETFNS